MNNLLSQRGATMVEFAFVAALLFMLIGLMVDVSVGFFRYSVLTHIVADAAREASTVSTRITDCGRVKEKTEEIVSRRMQESLGAAQADQFTFNACISEADNSTPVIELVGQFTYRCMFSCPVLGNAFTLQTSSRIPLQQQSCAAVQFDCPAGELN